MAIDLEAFTLPVDPDLFNWCLGIYNSFANQPVIKIEGSKYTFTDIPLNRGMKAVTKELIDTNTPEKVRMSILTRIMILNEIFDEPELSAFIKEGDIETEVLISPALIKACATATIKINKDTTKFDISDIANTAQRLTEEQEDV